jgi:predicted TIM-barrel fold metal-dependent hydrolase
MGGVDILCDYVGAGKLVFGSGLPYCCPSSEMLMVKSAKISEEDQSRIFSGNLLRLLAKHGNEEVNS